MEDLKVTLIQTELVWEKPLANRKHFTQQIEAIKEDTDLILLPEMFTTGFSMTPEAIAETPRDETLKWMRVQAQKTQAAISGSLIVKENGHYYNRLYFVFPNGNYQTYDKRHLFSFAGEHQHYSAGDDHLILKHKGWKICPLICYDLRFPVWSRNTANYDLLFYIANWPKPRITSWDTLLKARSIENICFTAGLNRIGTDPNDNTYNGHSAIYNPIGEKLPIDNWEKEFTKTFRLSSAELLKTRAKFPFLDDRDDFEIKS